MIIDCLLVGKPDRVGSTWAQMAFNYQNLASGLPNDEPTPFTVKSAADAPATGAHLLWTLPYALRHGISDGNGVTFPLVPNRWLVLRAFYDAAGGTPSLSGTVLQSDLLTDAGGVIPITVSQYPDPARSTTTRRIGGATALADWTGSAGPAQPFLSANAPGCLTWSASYDNVRNVFSVHDPMEGAAGTYSFLVLGWYADPTTDPTQKLPTETPDDWRSALSKLFGWSVGEDAQAIAALQQTWRDWAACHGFDGSNFDPAKVNLPPQLANAIKAYGAWWQAHGIAIDPPGLPRQMVCQGFVAQVDWKGADESYGTGAPGGGSGYPDVAAGNTATEAIAAWLAKKTVEYDHGDPSTIPVIEQAIEAFQKGILLDLATDPAGTEAKLHAAEFAAVGNKRDWIVVLPEVTEANNDNAGQMTVPLDPVQTQALIVLNAAQDELEQTQENLVSQQAEMFGLIYKQMHLPRSAPQSIANKIASAITAIESAITASRQRKASAMSAVDAALETLRQMLGDAYVVKQVSLPASYSPNDPVLMVARAQGDTKFAAPGAYDDDDFLYCRGTGQTVSGITIRYDVGGNDDPITLTAKDLLAGGDGPGTLTLPVGQPIPKEAQDLWMELMFLDTGAAPYLARIYFARRGIAPSQAQMDALTEIVRQQQMAPWDGLRVFGMAVQAAGEAGGLVGVLPSKVAVSYRTGQPWTPVFMDWRVVWYPSSMEPSGELTDWVLGPTDFEWTGTGIPKPATPLIHEGRAVFNPRTAQDIAARLAHFQDSPDYDKLDKNIRKALEEMSGLLARADIFTQSMAGLTQQLLTRMIAPNQNNASPETEKYLGDAPTDYRPLAGTTYTNSEPFFPLRAGHLQVIDLWVVDVYGQILRGKDPALGAMAPIPDLVRAQTVVTKGGGNESYVQLVPRLSQTARLNFDTLDAASDSVFSNSSDRTSPICGYVIPNHLDTSLMVYDAAGAIQGSVIKVYLDPSEHKPGNSGLRWDAPPGSDAPLGAPPHLANAHLQSFIIELLAQSMVKGGGVLDALLDHIDSALWPLGHLGPSGQGNAALLGPTLAVVRARITATLDGYPAYNQSWIDTGAYFVGPGDRYDPRPTPVMSVPLPVRVGDTGLISNGIMGYFLNDAYDRFHAVYGAGPQTGLLRRALASGVRRRGSLRGMVPAAPAEVALLKLDPGGSYVVTDHQFTLPPDGTKALLTLLVDPRGAMPVVSGWQPLGTQGLPAGPISTALSQMVAAFRVGPLLVDPQQVQMPLPAEVQGAWSFAARSDITGWAPEASVTAQDAKANLEPSARLLSEGWLVLRNALKSTT
ncbi:hypothetical protein CWS72_14575 [Telmatospirillum siberiense]|uniref:Uncharacterized protein n=1 Tax=Telmatospirillum siberiense TaxID=382514 RepID=A0A2N3PU35_9PROT|nr:hypothetical protein CWS72_14575 [Telmatospirillum siberiense]